MVGDENKKLHCHPVTLKVLVLWDFRNGGKIGRLAK